MNPFQRGNVVSLSVSRSHIGKKCKEVYVVTKCDDTIVGLIPFDYADTSTWVNKEKSSYTQACHCDEDTGYPNPTCRCCKGKGSFKVNQPTWNDLTLEADTLKEYIIKSILTLEADTLKEYIIKSILKGFIGLNKK